MIKEITAPVSLYPPWKELVKIAQTWDYDSVHTHEEIASILNVKKQTAPYYHAVSKADEELVLIGKHLEVVIKTGYRVIRPDEYIRAANDKVRQALKHDKIGLIRSLNAPRGRMDEKTKKEMDEHTISMSKRHALFSSTAKPLFEIEQQQAKRVLRNDNPKRILLGENNG